MRMNAQGLYTGVTPLPRWASTSATGSRYEATIKPPPARAVTRRNVRRVGVIVSTSPSLPVAGRIGRRRLAWRGAVHLGRREVNRLADAQIRAAPAQVAGHSGVDL